jgi:putative ubiquitin-RnfH superfamily antitoxin RatB of RatAB toxin-antitoxin module
MGRREVLIEVAYAEPLRSIVKTYRLLEGARVADALAEAAADPDFTGVELMKSPVGIFGRLTRGDQELNDGDRVEIYRPLAHDPKLARRARAALSTRPPGSPRRR